jgi:hypothetical protein
MLYPVSYCSGLAPSPMPSMLSHSLRGSPSRTILPHAVAAQWGVRPGAQEAKGLVSPLVMVPIAGGSHPSGQLFVLAPLHLLSPSHDSSNIVSYQ